MMFFHELLSLFTTYHNPGCFIRSTDVRITYCVPGPLLGTAACLREAYIPKGGEDKISVSKLLGDSWTGGAGAHKAWDHRAGSILSRLLR